MNSGHLTRLINAASSPSVQTKRRAKSRGDATRGKRGALVRSAISHFPRLRLKLKRASKGISMLNSRQGVLRYREGIIFLSHSTSIKPAAYLAFGQE